MLMMEAYQSYGFRFDHGLLVVSLIEADNETVTPAAFDAMPYTPFLLLPADLDASIAEQKDYVEGRQGGFESYFCEMHQWNADMSGYVFVSRYYTPAQVKRRVRIELLDSQYNGWEPELFPWRVGFMHGWLSALALTDRELAMYGVQVLIALVNRRLKASQRKRCARR